MSTECLTNKSHLRVQTARATMRWRVIRVFVNQHYAQANDWYRKAAQQANAAGEYNLGLSYENGRGVPKDLKEAEDWYKKAAAQGVAGCDFLIF